MWDKFFMDVVLGPLLGAGVNKLIGKTFGNDEDKSKAERLEIERLERELEIVREEKIERERERLALEELRKKEKERLNFIRNISIFIIIFFVIFYIAYSNP